MFVDNLPGFPDNASFSNGILLGFDESGTVHYNLQDSTGSVAITTGARWHDGKLYISSLQGSDVFVYDLG